MLPVIIAYQSPAESAALQQCVEQVGCSAKPVATLAEAIEVLREEDAAVMLLGKTFEGSCVLDVIPGSGDLLSRHGTARRRGLPGIEAGTGMCARGV
jgi:hypothetical protein